MQAPWYWNWDRYAESDRFTPFNGNSSSMDGSGFPGNLEGPRMGFQPPYDKIPSAGGGGCVTEGPFKEYATVTFNFAYQLLISS